MSKNYKVIHYIQDRMKGFDPKFVNCVVRCFNYNEDIKADSDCLSNTVALYVCARYFGYDPEICYGLCVLDGLEFYHAWLEVNDTVIDLAIYGNVNYSRFSLWDRKLDTPFIGPYAEAFCIYGKTKFDDDWPRCSISKATGKPMSAYIDQAPGNAMWKLVYRLLDKTPDSKTNALLRGLVDGMM